MRNRLLSFSKCFVSISVFAFVLSLHTGTVQGKERNDLGAPKGKMAQVVKRVAKDRERFRKAVALHKRYIGHLMDLSGVVGTGIGSSPEGEPVVRVFTSRTGVTGLPATIEGIPVEEKVSGRFYALVDPTARFVRPVPIGISTGHPAITAGTIGARVVDRFDPNRIYALSNNHVYAAINSAAIGESVIQPGSFDGGALPDDFIGALADYKNISFCEWWWFWLICSEINTVDAAIVDVIDPITGEVLVDIGTPPDGYDRPNSIIHPAYGNPDIISEQDDNLSLLVGQSVQKYGRTTGLTYGTIDTYGVSVNVCYDDSCDLIARFEDQLVITPGSFSGGGDSGSLIVTNDENKNPVGLLFAGSDTDTLANRIDRVLVAFNVDVDSGPAPVLSSIMVGPATATIEEGHTQQFTAIGYYNDESTADLTQMATWHSDDTDVATIDSSGLATGVSVGTTQISASQGAVTSNTATLEVIPAHVPILLSITVGPATATIEEGHTQQFTAIGYYNDESTADLTQMATWHSDDTDVATIDSSGLAAGVSAGTTQISASQGTVTSNTATLEVTVVSGPALSYILVQPATATIEEGHTQQFTVTGYYNDESTADLTQTAMWHSDDTDVATIDSSGLATGVSVGTTQISASEGTVTSDTATLEVTATAYAGPYLEIGKVYVTSDTWTTVTLGRNYQEMVVVCTPNYDDDLLVGTTMPVVSLVRNALGSSFEVKLGQAVGGSIEISEAWVHYMVVEAGVYNLPGLKMEADTFVSTVTDYNRSWVGQSRSYSQSYANPVVVGQVLTNSSDLWTVFWCRGSNKNNPPSAGSLWVGKHKGEDPRARLNERIGYIVIEAGAGTIDGIGYEAGLGPDTIQGVVNSPPYSYPLSGLSFIPSTGIVTQAAMDGGNGSWALLYGNDPQDALYPDRVYLAVDEDQAWDSERSHTHEQVGYILFE